MSFLHDKKTYLKIIEGQTAPVAVPSAQTVTNGVAKKLLHNLDRDLTGGTQPLNITTSADNVELKAENLKSLSSFALFLYNTKLSIDGKRLVLSGQEFNSLDAGSQDNFLPINVVTSKNPNAQNNVNEFFYNKDSFVAYLQYLKQKAKQAGDDTGKFLQVMLNKLINEVNMAVGSEIIKAPSKSTPENPNDIDDDVEIDRLTKEFDQKQPFIKGVAILRARDIKSKEDLNAWMKSAPEAMVVKYDNDIRSMVSYSDPNANLCNVVNILFSRAKAFQNTALPNEKAKYAFYAKKIEEIGPDFTGPSGQCVISGVTNAPTSGTEPGQQAGQAGKGNLSTANLNKIIKSLPLRTDRIRFDYIRGFFKQYLQLNPGMATYTNAAEQAMKDASSMTVGGSMDEFNMMANPGQVKIWLKAPQGQYYLPLIDKLKAVLENTRYVIADLRSRFADVDSPGEAMIKNKEYLDYIESQIGQTNSIYEQNMRQLQTWESQVNLVKKTTIV